MKYLKIDVLSLVSFLFGSLLITGCGGGGGGGGSGDETITNNAPDISGNADSFVQASRSYFFMPDADDADGDELTFSVQNLPGWANFDTVNGELSGQPDELDVGQYNDITISVSDGIDITALAVFSIDVLEPPLGRNNINTDNATVTQTGTGYDAQGNVTVDTGGNTTELADADLNFEFDAGDNLVNVTGTALLPPEISDYLSVDNPFQVRVGLYTGAQINRDPDIGIDSIGGIRLVDELQYLVFFLGADLGVTFNDPNNPNQVPITLGIGEAQNLIIMDPTDPFAYVFGYLNGLGYGNGQSAHGLIPYVPNFADGPDAFAELDSFFGHKVEKGIFPVGIRIFDLLSFSGMRVIRDPQFSDIDWTEPLNSAVHYQAGYSGQADLEFGILGIGLFSYQLAEMSATFDVGLQRQHFAMQGVYQPTETSQPVWLPVRPSPEPFDQVLANIFADGDGDFSMELRGQFQSTFPEARLYGSMQQTLDGLTLTGTIDSDLNPIQLIAHADSSAFTATLDYSVDINDQLESEVLSEMDNQIAQVQAAVTESTDAIAGYDLAVSLNGIRSQLPEIADRTIAVLDRIPGTVYTQVYNSARDYINNGERCFGSGIFRVCYQYRDYVSATGVARSAATSARNDAIAAIAPHKSALETLKIRANEVDDEALRAALQSILLTVYNNRTFDRTFSYTYSRTIDYGIGSFTIRRTFSHRVNQTVIPAGEAELIRTAADNVDDIPGAYEFMINTQQIVDSFPTEQVIEEARQQVQEGLSQVPSFDGAGYRVTADGGSTAYIILDGENQEVQFNLLDAGSVAENIINHITNRLIDSI